MSTPNELKLPLDPVLADISKRWNEAGIPDLYDGCLDPHGGPVSRERARNMRAFFYPKPVLPRGLIESRVLDCSLYGGSSALAVRITHPHTAASTAQKINTLVYFHGGGFIVGDLDSHDAHAIRLANETGSVVISVDYRLAPEHRFPAAYDDCLAATRWANDNLAQWGGHAQRLAVGGDSAGGNLAAAVAITCRDTGIGLAAQLLLYPATDLSCMNGMPEKAYLGEELKERLDKDPRVSPFHAATHVGLAPAILAFGTHDFLYKDNLAYAQVLRSAGVALTYREYPTLNHGFFSYTAISAVSLAAALQVCADLKSLFDSAKGSV
jgi:acetyl esterase